MSVFVQQIGLYFSDKQECICPTNRYVFVFPTEQLQMEEAKFGRQAVSSLPVALFPFSSLSGLYSVHICCIFLSFLLHICFIFLACLLYICFNYLHLWWYFCSKILNLSVNHLFTLLYLLHICCIFVSYLLHICCIFVSYLLHVCQLFVYLAGSGPFRSLSISLWIFISIVSF